MSVTELMNPSGCCCCCYVVFFPSFLFSRSPLPPPQENDDGGGMDLSPKRKNRGYRPAAARRREYVRPAAKERGDRWGVVRLVCWIRLKIGSLFTNFVEIRIPNMDPYPHR